MSRNRALAALLWATMGSLLCCCPAQAQEVRWRTEYNAAWKEASETGKPLFVEVGSPTCTWCRRLHESTFRDPRVVRELNEKFIPVMLDGTINPKFVQALNIHAYPALVFGTADGQLLGSSEGYLSADEFLLRCTGMLGLVPPPAPSPVKAEPKPARVAEKDIGIVVVSTVLKGVREQLAAHHLVQGQSALLANDAAAARASLTKVLEFGPDTKAAALARRHLDQAGNGKDAGSPAIAARD